jgi:excisionase family DNA binding protein
MPSRQAADDEHDDRPPLSVNEVSRRLVCDPWTVRRMIRRGDLHAFRVGNRYRVPARELDRFR